MKVVLRLLEDTKENIKVINVNDINYSVESTEIEKKRRDNEITYILYTSGSTGKPKGVYQCHKNVLYFIKSYTKELDITNNDKITLFSSLSHDAAVMDIYGALLNGATLYPVNIKEKRNFKDIIKWLEYEEITIWHSVPTIYRYLIKAFTEVKSFPKLRFIVLGGENVIENDIKNFNKFFNNTRLMNLYGQTESSFNSAQIFTAKSIFNGITIGKPVEGTEIIVIDENREEVSPLKVGEIVILSDHIALGYWNNKELTKQVFEFKDYGRNLYWTGDLGRLLDDGNIKFVGRKNTIVKIRGYRIDIGDIESNLLDNEDIKQVAVISSEDKNKEVFLYALLVSDIKLDISKIKSFISRKLPEYMIPNEFIQIESLPTTQSEKIDKKALLEILSNIKKDRVYEAPRDEIEEKLVQIWCEILEVDKIGINDNFFELGGHSLKAIQIISLIEKRLNKVIILPDFLETPTISGLYECINRTDEISTEIIEKLPRKEYYECSYGQKRLWIINQINPNNTQYNMPGYFTLYEKVNESVVRATFQYLVKRHEALKTRFKTIDENIVQIIDKEVNIPFDFRDISMLEIGEREIERNKIRLDIANTIFNLEVSPLIKVVLLKVNEEEFDIVYCMHHIISDGYSMEILKKEFGFIYDAYKKNKKYKLEELRIQYKDFASWQNALIKDKEKMKGAKEFWYNQLHGKVQPISLLPDEYSNNELMNRASSAYRIVINENLKESLIDLSTECNISLFVLMVSALKIMLWDLTKQNDIIVGTASFGRENSDLKNVIGYFINTTILRTNIREKENVKNFLKRTNKKVLKALQYQSYPIELLLDDLKITYPKINVFFNMLNMGDKNKERINDFSPQKIEEVQDNKFDITMYVFEYKNAIEIRCVYFRELFDFNIIEAMMDKYVNILESIIKESNQSLKAIVKTKTSRRKI